MEHLFFHIDVNSAFLSWSALSELEKGNPIDIRKVKPKTDTDICLECGVCIEVCPMAAVDPMDVTRVPGTCIKCCACVKKCPVGAKHYDDHGYLYHQHELEEMYSDIRKEPELFY